MCGERDEGRGEEDWDGGGEKYSGRKSKVLVVLIKLSTGCLLKRMRVESQTTPRAAVVAVVVIQRLFQVYTWINTGIKTRASQQFGTWCMAKGFSVMG